MLKTAHTGLTALSCSNRSVNGPTVREEGRDRQLCRWYKRFFYGYLIGEFDIIAIQRCNFIPGKTLMRSCWAFASLRHVRTSKNWSHCIISIFRTVSILRRTSFQVCARVARPVFLFTMKCSLPTAKQYLSCEFAPSISIKQPLSNNKYAHKYRFQMSMPIFRACRQAPVCYLTPER